MGFRVAPREAERPPGTGEEAQVGFPAAEPEAVPLPGTGEEAQVGFPAAEPEAVPLPGRADQEQTFREGQREAPRLPGVEGGESAEGEVAGASAPAR